MLLTGEFKMYDFGEKENLKRYGQKVPPFWDTSKIQHPLHLFAGSSDELADPKDVAKLWQSLPP